MTDEELARFAALEARVAALELERGARTPAIRPSDRRLLLPVLPVVAGLFGSELFLLNQLFGRGGRSLELALGGRSSTSLGQAFGRCADCAIGDFVIEKAGKEGSRTLWRVRRQVQPAATCTRAFPRRERSG